MIENYNDALSVLVLIVIIVVISYYFLREISKGRISYLQRIESEYYDYDDDDIFDEEE